MEASSFRKVMPRDYRRVLDQIRAAEAEAYGELIDEVEPLAGARDLIERLRGEGATVILASSAKQEEVDHYLDLLDARELVDGWTTSADVESTKPEPDLVLAALEKAGGDDPSVMVGDSVWDVKAAKAASVSACSADQRSRQPAKVVGCRGPPAERKFGSRKAV